MEVINRSHEWEVEEDAKTLKAVMFLMIQEHVRKIPNDQELGKHVRKVINKFNENN